MNEPGVPNGREEVLDALVIEHHADGGSRGDKFERDRRLLEQEVREHPHNARAWFYLANTYRDLGLIDKALNAYRQRVRLYEMSQPDWTPDDDPPES